MDPPVEAEAPAPPPSGSNDLGASLGEKRPAERISNGDGGAPAKKKARGGPGTAESMRRVAEIVLVLSAMAKMRGGRSPTAAEVDMMAEARSRVAELCGELAPKDFVPRDAIGAVMEDLGLNRARDQRLGFGPQKMSITDKMLFAKKKMEECKGFASRPASHPSQRPPVTESCGTSNTVRIFPSDKPAHSSVVSGSIHSASSSSQVSSVASLPLSGPYPSNGVRASAVSCGLSSSRSSKDSCSPALSKSEKPASNGALYASQVRVSASPSGHLPVKAEMWPLQPQPNPLARSGLENKVAVGYTSANVEGVADKSLMRVAAQPSRDQNYKAVLPQATSGSLPHQPSQAKFGSLPHHPPQATSGSHPHQPLQNTNYGHSTSTHNGHNEISRFIQKLLQPQLLQHPTWTPPSRDYMNKALSCQVCKLTINEIETVLVCDACEKGYHLKCILSPNQKGIPRGEWHCSRCLGLSNGKPLPPKYGRVMRNITTPKMSLITSGVQASPEKKVLNSDQKINQQVVTANGNAAVQGPLAGTMSGNCVEWAPDMKMSSLNNMQGNRLLSNRQELDGQPSSECMNSSMTSTTTDVPSSGMPDERSTQQIYVSELSSHEHRLDMEPKSEAPAKLADALANSVGHSQAAKENSSTRDVPPSCTTDERSIQHTYVPHSFAPEQRPETEIKPQPPTELSSIPIIRAGHDVQAAQENSSTPDVPPCGKTDDKSTQDICSSESSSPKQRPDTELKTQPLSELSDASIDKLGNAQASQELQHVDQEMILAEFPLKQDFDDNSTHKNQLASSVRETIECNASTAQNILAGGNVGTAEAGPVTAEQGTFRGDGLHCVDWIGDSVEELDEKTLYQSCRINGVTYKLQDHALLCSSNDRLVPSKLQAMWEDRKTSSKWVSVSHYCFPSDLPSEIQQPCATEKNEVFKSNHDDNVVLAGLIQGPCEVLPPDKFKEEPDRRTQLGPEATMGLRPLFLCKWVYDRFKGHFQSV